jgi:hypothetical protein
LSCVGVPFARIQLHKVKNLEQTQAKTYFQKLTWACVSNIGNIESNVWQ